MTRNSILTQKQFVRDYLNVPVSEYPNQATTIPLVSVIVVTYQHAHFIQECLDGILAQQVDFTYEIIVGDDESMDGTRELCISYAEQYPDRIRLLLHSRANNIEIDSHPTGRFNFLYNLFLARGKYVAFCEGDDYWMDPMKLKNQVEMLEREGAFGSCHPIRKHINREEKDFYLDQPIEQNRLRYFLPDLLKPWQLGNGSLILRREKLVITEWHTTVSSGDIALVLSGIRDSYLLYYPKIASVWRVHPGGVSATHSGVKKVMDMSVLYHYINEYYNGHYRDEILKAMEQEIHLHISRNRERDLKDAIKDGRFLTANEHVAALLNKISRRLSLRSK